MKSQRSQARRRRAPGGEPLDHATSVRAEASTGHQRADDPDPQASDMKLVAKIAARVPGELAFRLRRVCQESGRSFNQIVAEALEQYLGKIEN